MSSLVSLEDQFLTVGDVATRLKVKPDTVRNDIGNFFGAEPDKAEAAKGVANHLRRSWDPRTRREIIAHYQKGGAGLEDVPRSGIALLAEE